MKKRIEYLKENFENISLEELKKELSETKDKKLKDVLESLISIKEADSVDAEFVVGVKHGGAREGAGRKSKGTTARFLGLSYKFLENDVIDMKKNLEEFKEKNNIKTTTEAIRKIFLEVIKK